MTREQRQLVAAYTISGGRKRRRRPPIDWGLAVFWVVLLLAGVAVWIGLFLLAVWIWG